MSAQPRPWALRAAVGLSLAVVAAFDLWTVGGTPDRFNFGAPKGDYYNLLVQGFQHGHLYLNAAPDPALLAVPEGARPGSAPFLLDASLYRGHYYLYFGVTPAVVLFWPYAALTGYGLPEAVGVLVFALAGSGLAVLIWLEARRRWFPQTGAVWSALAVLAIGLGSAVPSTLRHPLFYEAATAAGFAFAMAELWCLTRARRSPNYFWAWLGGAGLAAGLSVGSRANLAPAAILVLGLGVWGASRGVPMGKRRRTLLTGLLAAGICAGAIGGGLAAYNSARFGNPWEFGHTYQLGTNPQRMFQKANLKHNLGVYYLSPPEWNAYFPFVAPRAEPPKPLDYVGREHAHGEWIWLPLVGVGLLTAIWSLRRQSHSARKELAWCLGLPALGFGLNFLLTGSAGVRANRYMLDFHPMLVLTTALALGLAWAGGRWRSGWFALMTGLGLSAVCLFNVLASIQVHGFFAKLDPVAYGRLAEAANRIAWPLLRWGAPVGDREVLIRWPATTPIGEFEPFGGAGTPDFDDLIRLEYGGPGRARFVYDGADEGTAAGEWFSFLPGTEAKIHIGGALLLPRAGHPWYAARPQDLQAALKRTLAISVDGELDFNRAVPSHDSSPRLQRWGVWTTSSGRTDHFSGRILGVSPRAVDSRPAQEAMAGRGTIRFRVSLRRDRYGLVEPLVEFGDWGHFDLVALRYARPGYIQLIHDQAAGGATRSAEIAVDYGRDHEFVIETPQATDDLEWGPAGPTRRLHPLRTIRVKLDGVQAFESANPPFHYANPQAVLGADLAESSVGRALFAGSFTAAPRIAALGQVIPGSLEFQPGLAETWGIERGVLLRLTSAGGDQANLVWRRVATGRVQIGWNEGDSTAWSVPVFQPELQPLGVRTQPLAGGLARVEISLGREQRLVATTDLFGDGPVWAEAVQPERWSGTANLAGGSPPDAVRGLAEATELPGIVRITFGLPDHRLTTGLPLLSAGITGAADSVYLRELTDGRFVLGLDHWMFSATESGPFDLAPDRVHAVVIELGSLTSARGRGRNHVRLWIDGQRVLDRSIQLYPAAPDSVVFGGNPLGMSTSSAQFEGRILAVRRHLPARP